MTASTAAGMIDRARRVLAGGVNSNARLSSNDLVLARGDGPYVWDADGRRYVDYLLGRGPAFLGHSHPGVLAAVRAAEGAGMCLGTTTTLEIEAAEALVDVLGWPDMVRFTSSGTEADQVALRIARAATGRPKVIQFQDHYHGWVDTTAVTADDLQGAQPRTRGQPVNAVADTVVLPWNDIDAVRTAFERHDAQVAAVICEPVMMNGQGTFPRPGFLTEVAAEARARGAILIFDEVITGLRLGPSGAAGIFGVTPDLAVYAKALGSGWPVAAVAGRAELMELLDSGANHGDTYNGNMAAMAAVRATLDALADGSAYEHVHAVGSSLMRELSHAAEEAGVPMHVRGFPAAFYTNLLAAPAAPEPHDDYRPDTTRFAALMMRLRELGVWIGSRGSWYVSTAHSLDHVRHTAHAFAAALNSLPQHPSETQELTHAQRARQ